MLALWMDTWVLYPAALGIMVLSKSFGVLKAAVTPRVLPPGITLVTTNSRLTVFGLVASGVAGAVAAGIARVRAFGADALVVSLGFDASEHEPLAALCVTGDGFSRAGKAVAAMGLPAAIIQEGGYNTEAIGGLLARFLGAWG